MEKQSKWDKIKKQPLINIISDWCEEWELTPFYEASESDGVDIAVRLVRYVYGKLERNKAIDEVIRTRSLYDVCRDFCTPEEIERMRDWEYAERLNYLYRKPLV